MKNCRGQCYDGAANMAGVRTGVATQLLAVERRALYTHCYGHSLNLACQDTIRKIKVIRNAFDMTFELSKLKYSLKRNATYKRIKDELSPGKPGFRTLCPTRWTVKSDSLASVEANYSVLQNNLEEFSQMARRDFEASAKVNGVATEMTKFDFLFGVMLGSRILRLVDNLSCTLQKKELSAAEGQVTANVTIKVISALRTDEEFDIFWQNVVKKSETVDVSEPMMPRKREALNRYEAGIGEGSHPESPKDLYRITYYTTIDGILSSIRDRFDQPGYKIYAHLQNLLTKTASADDYSEDMEVVVRLYEGDIEPARLKSQLEILTAEFQSQQVSEEGTVNKLPVTFGQVKDHLISLGHGRELLSEVVTI
ncbi:zinc finger MYM-type protein 1-like [Corticium candelabrum]|uniref:zinc finger MYM-type protein 1-like n=1 Tax=Corticium candelabrum TaxID=121492 RepID=UPI002E25A941|nr:zinc finger MYM-type protein 1-like [Corticium candelabrum]